MTRRLTAAIGTRDHTAALKAGEVTPEGIELDFVEFDQMTDAYRRMVDALEFDVCEMAPTTYLAAREAGVPLTSIPVYLARRFHHGAIVCRAGSGITQPKDLNGRRVGVRAYTVSAGVWIRGLLATEYGVELDSITWVVEDDDHVTGVSLPPNVERTEAGDSLVAQFARGDLDAAVTGAAGIGRADLPEGTYALFPRARELDAEWYQSSTIYPIHALVAIRADLLDDDPTTGSKLMRAFVNSKAPFLSALQAGVRDTQHLREYATLSEIVGEDPLPYGITKNTSSLQALIDFSFDQHILTSRPEVPEILAPRGS